MIVVTGATGKLGQRIVEQLVELLPAGQIGATAREPTKADALTKKGVRVRQGDFAQPASLASAFEGVTQLLLVSSNAEAYGGDALAQHRAVIDAARAAGARRIVYTSHMGVSPTSAFSPMHNHAATEAMLRDSGIAYTALRNGFYASTVPMAVGDAASSGVLATPQDGKVSWTAHADLAAAAAQIVMQEGRFDGPTPPLTAAEALDFADVATILSQLHGRPVEWQPISDEEQEKRLSANGVPAHVIGIMLGMYRAARVGEFAAVDPTLATLLGRNPTSLRDVLAAGKDDLDRDDQSPRSTPMPAVIDRNRLSSAGAFT